MTEQTNWFLLAAGLAGTLASFGAGTTFSWSSPVLTKLQTNTSDNPLGYAITPIEESWICSLVNLGASFGPFISTLLTDRIGRKSTLLYVSLIMICSYVITAFARVIELYYLARFLVGLGVGCTYSITPMYLGEIAEDQNRGLLGVLFCVLCTSGTLFSYIIGPYMTICYLSLFCVVPLIVFLIVFGLFIPESPYFYILKSDYKQAEIALRRLRGKYSCIEKELALITDEVRNNEKKLLKDLLKTRAFIRGLCITCGLIMFQQISGISVFLGYLQSIFDATGANSIQPEIASIIIGSIQVIVSVLTSQLVDRLGRRLLLLLSMIGLTLSTGLLGLYFFIKMNLNYNVDIISWLPISCLILFMFSYNFGLGPISWTLLGELFPTNCKILASTITTFLSFFSGFLTTVFFPSLMEVFGMAISLWLFTVFTIIGLVFVINFVPETKGLSLIDIQYLLNNSGRKCERNPRICKA